MIVVYDDTIPLPDTPSELIMLALKDLVTVRNLPGYVIDMDSWHDVCAFLPSCNVCYAGAVMANTLKVSEYEDAVPTAFTEDICNKLLALDQFRRGQIRNGLFLMGIDRDCPNVYPPQYHDNPEGFLMAMTDLANDLALEGL